MLAVAERELLLDIDLKLLKFISNSYIELDLVDPGNKSYMQGKVLPSQHNIRVQYFLSRC